MCICPDGARGKNCEELYGICKTGVCGTNGNCMDLADNSYKCVCKEGYTGPFCETKLDACEPHPCKNDGVCESRSSSYTCKCKPGKTRIFILSSYQYKHTLPYCGRSMDLPKSLPRLCLSKLPLIKATPALERRLLCFWTRKRLTQVQSIC